MGVFIVLGTGPLRGSKGDGISSFPRRGPGRYPQYPRIRSVIRFSLGSYLVLPSPCPLVPPPTGGGDSSPPPYRGGYWSPPPTGGGYNPLRLQYPPYR